MVACGFARGEGFAVVSGYEVPQAPQTSVQCPEKHLIDLANHISIVIEGPGHIGASLAEGIVLGLSGLFLCRVWLPAWPNWTLAGRKGEQVPVTQATRGLVILLSFRPGLSCTHPPAQLSQAGDHLDGRIFLITEDMIEHIRSRVAISSDGHPHRCHRCFWR